MSDLFQVAESQQVANFVETSGVYEVDSLDVFEYLQHGLEVEGLVLLEALLDDLVQQCFDFLEAVAAVTPAYIEVTSLKWFTFVSFTAAFVSGCLDACSRVARLPFVMSSLVWVDLSGLNILLFPSGSCMTT